MQLCSGEHIEGNLEKIKAILASHDKPVDVLLLPENATLLSNDAKLRQQAAQKKTVQHILNFFSKLAQEQQCWLIAGSILTENKQQPQRYFNRCPVFAPNGSQVTSYDKIHLFDVDLGSESWQESASISAGSKPGTFEINPSWKVGLSICYDLRFPELYRHYSAQNCNIFTVPSAFTVPTGKAHWDILLKARAIENQAYVLAAAQSGKHADGRETYGHSCILNPWGETLAELNSGEGIISASLDQRFLRNLKRRMPVLQHRKLS